MSLSVLSVLGLGSFVLGYLCGWGLCAVLVTSVFIGVDTGYQAMAPQLWIVITMFILIAHFGWFTDCYCGICLGIRHKSWYGPQSRLARPRARTYATRNTVDSFNKPGSQDSKDYKINNEIDYEKVRLMLPILEDVESDTAHEMIGPAIKGIRQAEGVIATETALQIASSLDLDLVLINEKGVPPVCKIVNLGKYKYHLEKKKKEQEKKQTHQMIKEFKFSCNINQHDIDIRTKAAKEHMETGDKVYFCV
jgi:hypothetical protein